MSRTQTHDEWIKQRKLERFRTSDVAKLIRKYKRQALAPDQIKRYVNHDLKVKKQETEKSSQPRKSRFSLKVWQEGLKKGQTDGEEKETDGDDLL